MNKTELTELIAEWLYRRELYKIPWFVNPDQFMSAEEVYQTDTGFRYDVNKIVDKILNLEK